MSNVGTIYNRKAVSNNTNLTKYLKAGFELELLWEKI